MVRPGKIVATFMSYLRTGGPGKEHRTNKLPPTRRTQERSKRREEMPARTSYPPPRILLTRINLCWVMHAPPERNLSQNYWPEDKPETNPVTIKPGQQATWHSSSPGFPCSAALYHGTLPNKVSCFISTCVSLDNSFPSVRQDLTLRAWKGSSFLQQNELASILLQGPVSI